MRAGALRVAAADPGRAFEPVVPSPPSALPPGPLRVTADFAATVAEPLPATAARLRTALLTAADELGLTVTDVTCGRRSCWRRVRDRTTGRRRARSRVGAR